MLRLRIATRGKSSRRGFTLVELMAGMLILIILAGIFFPIAAKLRKKSQILTMGLDFQSLVGALENYRADFGDYPKNGFAQTDSYYSGEPSPLTGITTFPQDVYRPDPARVDGCLAMALVGPGPAGLTINNSGAVGNASGYPNIDQDGADGPGFKSRYAINNLGTVGGTNVPVTWELAASPSAGATSITVQPTVQSPSGATLVAAVPPGTPPPFTAVSLGGPGSPDVHVPVAKWTTDTIYLAEPLQNAYSTATGPVSVSLLAPAGRTWGPYLPADKFKVAYIGFQNDFDPQKTTSGVTDFVPVLLDIWGNQILYFPAYNSYANHTTVALTMASATPTFSPAPSITATVGPLIGCVNPSSSACQYNSPMYSATGTGNQTGPAVFWDGAANLYLTNTPAFGTVGSVTGSKQALQPNGLFLTQITTGQIEAILYRLGDNEETVNSSNGPYNAITPAENFAVQAPYFLLSPGPDGLLEDLQIDAALHPGTTTTTYMNKSDDIYSFDVNQ